MNIEGTYLNIIKAYEKSTAYHIEQWKIESFPINQEKANMPNLTTFIQHSTGNPSRSN